MSGGDFDFEPIRGLPAYLPAGETLIWQGEPDIKSAALRIFHARKVAIYFALLVAWRYATALQDGATLTSAAYASLPLVGLGCAAVAILVVLAVLVCKTTVYSITSRRVVMRIGVALPITFNLPFTVVASAALKVYPDGTGTIPLALEGSNRLAYLVIWPHVRPWRIGRAEPALRCIPEAAKVAVILSQAAAAALPEKIQTAAAVPQDVKAGEKKPWPLAPAAA